MSFVSKLTRVNRLLKSKKSRDAYVLENIKRMVPFQIRTMRDERGWSQGQAGEAIGKPQNVVSRLESPTYGKLTLQTLLDIAHGFDVGLLIKFVPFSRLVREYEDLSSTALSAKSVADKKEVARLQTWASDIATAQPVIVAGRGTGKTAALIHQYFDHLTFQQELGHKGYRRSPFIISQRAEPTVTMSGKDTQKTAA